jgi:hypothetical protein
MVGGSVQQTVWFPWQIRRRFPAAPRPRVLTPGQVVGAFLTICEGTTAFAFDRPRFCRPGGLQSGITMVMVTARQVFARSGRLFTLRIVQRR